MAPRATHDAICSACGHANPPGSRFCRACGRSLELAPESRTETTEHPHSYPHTPSPVAPSPVAPSPIAPPPIAPSPIASPRASARPRWPIATALAIVLAVGGVAAGLITTGALNHTTTTTTTLIVRNNTRTLTVTAPSNASSGGLTSQSGTSPPASGGAGLATYRGSFYTASYPAGWTLLEQDEPVSTYTETKFEAPDRSVTVLIDRTPGGPVDPALEAQGVEKETSRTSGYRRLRFQPITLGGRAAFEWEFSLPSGRRVDVFMNVGGGRYAVLGYGADFAAALTTARQVAESIQPD